MCLRPQAAALILVGLVLAIVTPQALADGDPASDVLLGQDVFLPYATILSGKLSPADRQLIATVAAAKKAGYPIKVAVISSRDDLGVVGFLLGEPQKYARFLGEELAYLHHGPLLVVMPSGFGFYEGRKPVSRQQRLLRPIQIAKGDDGLQQAATTAVARLSAGAGRPIEIPPVQSGSSAFDRALIAGGGVALLGLLGFFTVLWWGSRSPRRGGGSAAG